MQFAKLEKKKSELRKLFNSIIKWPNEGIFYILMYCLFIQNYTITNIWIT
jgi:hypothetical protein